MRLGIATLTLFVGLGIAGLASAQEEPSGSWFTRLFSGSPAKGSTEAAKDSKKTDMPPPSALSAAQRLRQAQATLYRRQQVCLKLREFADLLEDEELRRKADLLDQRAWDAYVAATGADRVASRVTKLGARSASAPAKNTKEDR